MSTVLITGANKGIGAGFVAKYLSRPNTTVVAAVRNASADNSKSLNNLPKGDGSKILTVEIDATSETAAQEAVKAIEAQGISHLDLVIANAGIFDHAAFVPVSQSKTASILEHVDVNAGGPLRLFQATLPLLQAAQQPKFVVISSIVGSIGMAHCIPMHITAYGVSKVAANYLLRRIHVEHQDLIAISFHPGAVATASGNASAKHFGLPEGAPTSVADSVDGMVAKIDNATRESASGEFLAFDDTPITW